MAIIDVSCTYHPGSFPKDTDCYGVGLSFGAFGLLVGITSLSLAWSKASSPGLQMLITGIVATVICLVLVVLL